MEGLKRKAIILSFIEEMNTHNSWTSETHVQKCVYFLQKGLGVPTEYDFILYKHGPFSFELRDELREMRTDQFVVIKPQYPYGPSYQAGSLAKALKEKYPKTIKKYKSFITFVSENISKDKVSELEKIATALYVMKDEGITVKKLCAVRVNTLKPHIPLDVAKDSCIKVKELLKKSESIAKK